MNLDVHRFHPVLGLRSYRKIVALILEAEFLEILYKFVCPISGAMQVLSPKPSILTFTKARL